MGVFARRSIHTRSVCAHERVPAVRLIACVAAVLSLVPCLEVGTEKLAKCVAFLAECTLSIVSSVEVEVELGCDLAVCNLTEEEHVVVAGVRCSVEELEFADLRRLHAVKNKVANRCAGGAYLDGCATDCHLHCLAVSVVDNADLTVAVQVFAERAGEIGCRCRETQGSGSHCNK